MTMPTADKLRYAIQALDQAIEHVRICLNPDSRPKDRERLSEFVAEYSRLVSLVACLQKEYRAGYRKDRRRSELSKRMLPKPFCQPVGFGGIRGEAYFNRGWAAFTVTAINTPAVEAKRLAA